MNIEFKKGEMVVTHGSGRVDIYTAGDVQNFLDSKTKQSEKLSKEILSLQLTAADINQSLEA